MPSGSLGKRKILEDEQSLKRSKAAPIAAAYAVGQGVISFADGREKSMLGRRAKLAASAEIPRSVPAAASLASSESSQWAFESTCPHRANVPRVLLSSDSFELRYRATLVDQQSLPGRRLTPLRKQPGFSPELARRPVLVRRSLHGVKRYSAHFITAVMVAVAAAVAIIFFEK
jgi:hypothetical protein